MIRVMVLSALLAPSALAAQDTVRGGDFPREVGPIYIEGATFDRLDAYTLLGQVGESTVANIVDPSYTVVAKIRKRYLGQGNR